jgi:hypothetical protein
VSEDHLSVEPVIVLVAGVGHDRVNDGFGFVTGELEPASRAHLRVIHAHSEVLREYEEP